MGVTEVGTYSLFDSLYPDYKTDKPVRLIEFFGGIGSQAKALERLGIMMEPWRLCEIDKFAVASYNAIHGTEFTTSDITQMHGEDFDVSDTDKYDYILTWSFPCWAKGSLVETSCGLIPIEEIQEGDFVISHDGQYHKVSWSGKTGTKEIYQVNTSAGALGECTANHKFYVRKRYYSWKGKNHSKRRYFTDPEWVECKDIMQSPHDYFCGLPVNNNSKLPEWDGIEIKKWNTLKNKNNISSFLDRPEFWWLVGKYVADGWHQAHGTGIGFSCGWKTGENGDLGEVNEVLSYLDALGVHATVTHERTSNKVFVSQKEWSEFLEPIGRGARNKEIPQFILDLPVDLLKSFLAGYLAGDGHCVRDGVYSFATSSRKLALGLSQVIAKVYHIGANVSYRTRGNSCVIEGRTVKYNPFWQVTFHKTSDITANSFYEDDFIWHKFRSVELTDKVEDVYDLTVEDAHSFVVNNCTVHNCQALSVAGLRKGMREGSGTSSSLIWEVRRILHEMAELGKEKPGYGLPKILLMENVPQVIDSKNVGDLNKMRDFLESLGYSNHLAILKGNDYGVPQARHRAFMISILGDKENPVYAYQFPLPCGCKWNMQDCLFDDFDSKQYLRDSVSHRVCEENAAFNRNTLQKLKDIKLCGRLNSHQAGGVFDPCGVSPTLTAGGASAVNVLYRRETDKEDSQDWNNIIWFGDSPDNVSGCDVTVPDTVEETAEFLFNDDTEEPDYNREPDYQWVPVVRDHVEYNLRTLSPKESLLIMDFDQRDFEKATLVTSNHQLHRQAGNSIVVNCIVALLGQFFPGKENVYREIAKIPPKDRKDFSVK